MRLFRNLSVGRKLAASAILAILLLGGLVLLGRSGSWTAAGDAAGGRARRRCRRRLRRSRRALHVARARHGAARRAALADRPRRWTALADEMEREVGRGAGTGARPRPGCAGRPGVTGTLDRAGGDWREYAASVERAGAAAPEPDRPARHRAASRASANTTRPSRRSPAWSRSTCSRGAAGGGAAAADDLPPGGGRRAAGQPALPGRRATRARRAGSAGPRRSCGCMPARWRGVGRQSRRRCRRPQPHRRDGRGHRPGGARGGAAVRGGRQARRERQHPGARAAGGGAVAAGRATSASRPAARAARQRRGGSRVAAAALWIGGAVALLLVALRLADGAGDRRAAAAPGAAVGTIAGGDAADRRCRTRTGATRSAPSPGRSRRCAARCSAPSRSSRCWSRCPARHHDRRPERRFPHRLLQPLRQRAAAAGRAPAAGQGRGACWARASTCCTATRRSSARILADPARLPHRSRIRMGEEVLDLDVCAIRDARRALCERHAGLVGGDRAGPAGRQLRGRDRRGGRGGGRRRRPGAPGGRGAVRRRRDLGARGRGGRRGQRPGRADVQAVAASAEELAASVAEITRQVADGAAVARAAAEAARATDGTVQRPGRGGAADRRRGAADRRHRRADQPAGAERDDRGGAGGRGGQGLRRGGIGGEDPGRPDRARRPRRSARRSTPSRPRPGRR